MSSSSTNEDDEVVFGPTGHKERCIAASLNLIINFRRTSLCQLLKETSPGESAHGEKFVEVYKKALTFRYKATAEPRRPRLPSLKDPGSQEVEGFIQESKLKINLFDREKQSEEKPQVT